MPTQWDHLSDNIIKLYPNILIEKINLWSLFNREKIKSFKDFNDYWSKYSFDLSETPVIIGYSMGGRLGLESFLSQLSPWAAGIFVSTHYGLNSIKDKKNRKTSDLKWLDFYSKNSISDFLKEWNKQDVFCSDDIHTNRFSDIKSFFEKNSEQAVGLKLALNTFSLANQKFLKTELENSPKPIAWIVGEHDKKFYDLSKDLSFAHSASSFYCIGDAGHRVHMQKPKNIAVKIVDFLKRLKV